MMDLEEEAHRLYSEGLSARLAFQRLKNQFPKSERTISRLFKKFNDEESQMEIDEDEDNDFDELDVLNDNEDDNYEQEGIDESIEEDDTDFDINLPEATPNFKREVILRYFSAHNNQPTNEQILHWADESFGSGFLKLSTIKYWTKKFKEGNTSVVDLPRSGRPQRVTDEELKQFALANPTLVTAELAAHFEMTPRNAAYRLKKLGFRHRRAQKVPHVLTERQRQKRVEVCTRLLQETSLNPGWFDGYITVDEKWVRYQNPQVKRYWYHPATPVVVQQPKGELHCRKVMLISFIDKSGLILRSFLPPGETMNSERYCHQLDLLHEALREKRPNLFANPGLVRFHHDNATPHKSRETANKLRSFGWHNQIVEQPAWSPDISPCDFFLFLSLSNFLRNKVFESDEEVKSSVDEFFRVKEAEEGFYER